MSSKTQKFFFSTQPRAILERENDAGNGPVPPLRAGKEDRQWTIQKIRPEMPGCSICRGGGTRCSAPCCSVR